MSFSGEQAAYQGAKNRDLEHRIRLDSAASCKRSCDLTPFGAIPLGEISQLATVRKPVTFEADQKEKVEENGFQPADCQKTLESDDADEPKEPFKFAGYLCTVLASMTSASTFLFIKLLPVEDNLEEKVKAILIRGLMVMLLCGVTMIWQGHTFKIARGEYLLNLFRCLFGTACVVLVLVGIMYITIGESTTIINASCIWTCVLSFVFLREPLPISLIAAMPLSLLGMILLAHPDLLLDTRNELPISHRAANDLNHTVMSGLDGFNTTATQTLIGVVDEEEEFFQHRWPGFVCALLASFFWASVTILLKFRKKTPIVTCSFYSGVGSVLIAVCMQLFVGFGAMPATVLECVLHLCIGIASFSTQYLFQWGLLFVPAGTYSVIRQLDIVFSFLFGIIFLNDLVLWTSVAGSVLIMIGVPMLVFDDHLVRGLKSLCSRQTSA